ncbi:hypothetical protein HGP14_15795 [Rhizobium sp. P32RR-XVIII]|uniref:hypothetical protein n=1 Tax=Rhizobium sp. P32RR-XVIII TaxID=2726738 RepID=UPI0014563E8B|nr:hypothetical protein [Rhizobium sp. P32RR-XVIII]NLS04819.1 hypothetical protein [Rhizobium sp. P32RR-XVIII]
MTRGHDRGPVGTFFVTFVLTAILIGASLPAFMLIFLFVAPFFHEWKGENPAHYIAVAELAAQGVLAAIGLALGLLERPRRTAAHKVERDNAAFLASNGFRDVGGQRKVIVDRDGNELVPDDFRTDAVVFKVRGRRGVRAKILLDEQGRMVSYVPAYPTPVRGFAASQSGIIRRQLCLRAVASLPGGKPRSVSRPSSHRCPFRDRPGNHVGPDCCGSRPHSYGCRQCH